MSPIARAFHAIIVMIPDLLLWPATADALSEPPERRLTVSSGPDVIAPAHLGGDRQHGAQFTR